MLTPGSRARVESLNERRSTGVRFAHTAEAEHLLGAASQAVLHLVGDRRECLRALPTIITCCTNPPFNRRRESFLRDEGRGVPSPRTHEALDRRHPTSMTVDYVRKTGSILAGPRSRSVLHAS